MLYGVSKVTTLATLGFVICMGCSAVAQLSNWGGNTIGPSSESQLITSAEWLQQHNIAVSEEALVAALNNPDAEVRGNAASELAFQATLDGNDIKAALPALAAALAAEIDPEAKICLAGTLAQLGDVRGEEVLKAMCYDSGLNSTFRLRAAEYSLNEGNQECHNAVVSIVLSGKPGERADAFHALQLFRHPSAVTTVSDVEIMCRALSDADYNVKVAASTALGFFGEPTGIQCLKDAIAHESRDDIRMVMQSSIDRLEKAKAADGDDGRGQAERPQAQEKQDAE